MASGIALAIDNATVYEKLKQSRDNLEMFFRSCMALANTMDLDHLLRVVLDEVKTTLDTEDAGVLLHDEAKGDLYWRAGIEGNGLVEQQSGALRVPLEGSVGGKVFYSEEAILINDPEPGHSIFKPFEKQSGLAIRNMIVVPLNTREKTVGLLVVMNRRGGRFVDDDVQILYL